MPRFFRNPYAWFWFHTEFWLPPEKRRPYTFIIRDYYHEHPLFVLWIVGFVGWWFGEYLFTFREMVIGSIFLLIGHLFWGKPYVPGEQEEPPYNPCAEGDTDVDNFS